MQERSDATSAGLGCPSAAKTTSTFDALGRVTQTTDGGGGYVKNVYSQNDVLQKVGPAPAGCGLNKVTPTPATLRLLSIA